MLICLRCTQHLCKPLCKNPALAISGDNKELVIIPGASHTDLYAGGDKNYIPYDRIADFFAKYLK